MIEMIEIAIFLISALIVPVMIARRYEHAKTA